MGHQVEFKRANPDLGGLNVQAAGAQAMPRDRFQAKDGGFRQRSATPALACGASVATPVPVPFRAAMLYAKRVPEIDIQGMRRCLAIAMLLELCVVVGRGRNHHQRLRIQFGQLGIDIGAIMGPIRTHTFHLSQQRRRRFDLAGVGVNGYLELAKRPGALSGLAVLPHFPLAFAINIQPQQGQPQPHQPFGNVVRQMEDLLQRQPYFNRQVAVGQLRPAPDRSRIRPVAGHLAIDPHGQRPALDQGLLVLMPIPNVASRLPAWPESLGCIGHTPSLILPRPSVSQLFMHPSIWKCLDLKTVAALLIPCRANKTVQYVSCTASRLHERGLAMKPTGTSFA